MDFLKTLKSSESSTSQTQGGGKVVWCKACRLHDVLCVICVVQSTVKQVGDL